MLRNPFYLMAGLYLLLDSLALAALALTTSGALPSLPGLSWLRVHLLTIGVVTQAVLGTLPGLVAARLGSRPPGPGLTWATWLLVNASFALLLVSMPAGASGLAAIAALGVFAAVLLTLARIHRLGLPAGEARASLRFFVVGPVFFLVGILMAISMLLGWWSPGGFVGLLEAHVHANVWGFLALVVAGVLLERVPRLVGRPLRFPGLVPATSQLLIVGAAGLVAGPWLASIPLTMLGLAVYVVGTAFLLANLVGTVLASRGWTPSLAHLITAYVWMIVPVFVAPAYLVITGKLPTGGVEAAAVSGLIAGWVLQIVLGAFVPRLREAQGDSRTRDGWWPSVVALNLGVLGIWIAPFWPAGSAALATLGYGLIVAGLVPPLLALVGRGSADLPSSAST